MTPLTTLKMAVFAPMPSANVSTAMSEKPGRGAGRESRSGGPARGEPWSHSTEGL